MPLQVRQKGAPVFTGAPFCRTRSDPPVEATQQDFILMFSVSVLLRQTRSRVLRLPSCVLFTVSVLVMSGHAAEVHLLWQDNSNNENGFEIERAIGEEDFQDIAQVGTDVTTFLDRTVADSVTYRYRVRAYNGAGYSAYSNIAASGPSTPAINTSPAIGTISDCSIIAGSMTRSMKFAVSDSQTDASHLSVAAHSSNPALVPDANIFLGGFGANRLVAVSTEAHRAGTTTITVTVSDGELSATTEFILQVHDIADSTVWPGNSLRGVPLASVHEGVFTVEFYATPPAFADETIVGLSQGAAAQPADLASAVRFNVAGWIDAMDGATYGAVTPIPYAPSLAYRVRMVINTTAHTYSIFVTPPGGSELTVGVDFRFGAGQETVNVLDTWNVWGASDLAEAGTVVDSVQTLVGGANVPDVPGMKSNDLGAPILPGSGIVNGSRFLLRSGALNRDHRFDHFRFGYQLVRSDAELTVRVDRLASIGSSSVAGLMFRNSLAPVSAYVGVFVTQANGVVLRWRTVDGGDVEVSPPFLDTAPQWLRLIRVDELFIAMGSEDGVDWQLVGFMRVELPEAVLGGVAVGSQDSSSGTTAIFSAFAVVTAVDSGQTSGGGVTAPEVPGMEAIDLGAPRLPGSGSVNGNGFVLRSGALNLDRPSDHFRFGYRPVPGDAELTVRVNRLAPLGGGSMAGLMFRNSLAPLSAYVGVFVTPANGLVLQWRIVDGGNVEVSPPFPGSAPQWLRLIRVDDLFFAMGSDDGVDWHLVEFTSVELPETVFGGIAVGSQDSSSATVAIFSGFAVD